MTVKQLIEVLNKYNDNLNVVIYVPGDDVGFWDIKTEEQITEEKYGDTDEKYVNIKIY